MERNIDEIVKQVIEEVWAEQNRSCGSHERVLTEEELHI
mgnify:CR=1 FL=1